MIYCTQNWWLSIATSNRGYEFLCFFWCFLLVCKFRGLLWGTPIWLFLKLFFFRENNHLEVCPHFTTPRSCQTPKTPLGLLWRKRRHIAQAGFSSGPNPVGPNGISCQNLISLHAALVTSSSNGASTLKKRTFAGAHTWRRNTKHEQV